jgi:DNA polymerase alpha subunit A
MLTRGRYVLERILSGEMTEIVVEQIHEYLGTVGENVKAGQVRLEDFVINKRLGKNPEDYPDGKSQPHVQVALRAKARGGSAKAGDVISYVFCVPEGGDKGGAKAAQADCAKSPDEVRKAGSELTIGTWTWHDKRDRANAIRIDYEFYLSHQILPPIERLCEPIEGTDRARLAECLGMLSRWPNSWSCLDPSCRPRPEPL